jgi:hypothetical protein
MATLLLNAKDPLVVEERFREDIKPLLSKYCFDCHGSKKAKAGIRVDYLDGSLPDKEVRHWETIRKQLLDKKMPPEDERQPSKDERRSMVDWVDSALQMARTRVRPLNGGARRLTVAQYRNTLRDLLGLEEDLTGILPPDATSKDGFLNNGQTMILSPLLVEAYFDIAERALDLAIVNENDEPVIQNFRMDFGRRINPDPCPDNLILGAGSVLLSNDDFVVQQILPHKPFAFNSFKMRTKWRFNEGYRGNDTVRGWRDYDSIYHAVFACMRGTGGYPQGKAYNVVPEGLLLRSSIPSEEVWQVDSTYGPRANFKISLRELPKHGRFRVKVKAAKYDDVFLLPHRSPTAQPSESSVILRDLGEKQTTNIKTPGIYQADVYLQPAITQIRTADSSRLNEQLIGYWGLNGNIESSTNSRKLIGRLAGDAKFIDSPIGVGGQAISLDGDGDAVIVPRDKLMDIGEGQFTVAAWIRPAELRQAGIVCLGKYSWTHGWYFDMPNDKGVLRIETANSDNQSNGTVASRPGVIRLNQWQHVAAVVSREENKTRLYVNGYEVAAGTIQPRMLDNPKVDFHIGRIQDSQQFKGEIDEVRFYNRALDMSELKALLKPGQRFVKAPPVQEEDLKLQIAGRQLEAKLRQPAFAVLRLSAGPKEFSVNYAGGLTPDRLALTLVPEESDLAKRFEQFENRSPWLGVHMGLRRDCGSTFSSVQQPVEVKSKELEEFVFEGAINNYPSDDVQPENDNYLAGIREIGVRSEYTDGRKRPRLKISSVEFEGPYYETWPPATHRRILIDSPNKDQPEVYALEVVRGFAERAFRRPITKAEEVSLMNVWKSAFSDHNNLIRSIKETLLVVLTSPQFLFLIEKSDSPKPEPITENELVSKLSYFLWNTAPDSRLHLLASEGKLNAKLDNEITRMIHDDRFEQFVEQFVEQWLSLEKFDVVEIDRKRYPSLTRNRRLHLRREPVELLKYMIRENLPARNLLQSDFVMANELVASYYGLGSQIESGFNFVPVNHNREHLGGLLAQTSILAGLSDGRDGNPIKRGAWIARKIIAEPPAEPPPNVPGIEEIDSSLPLSERLFLHRDHKGCAGCHSGIDPWGLSLEQFDAGGGFHADKKQQSIKLPDQTEVADYAALRSYLVGPRMDRVVFSLLKHITTYAVGRTLTYNELVFLEEQGLTLRDSGYRMQDLLRFVIHSDVFLKK